jgi:hypothetical protein
MKNRFITVASGSNRITLPKHMVDECEWDEKTPLRFKRVGKRIIIEEVIK